MTDNVVTLPVVRVERIEDEHTVEVWHLDRVRIIPHTIDRIPDCGSFEVWFPDERESVYFRWDDNAGRRSISKSVHLTQEQAKEAAQKLAREEQDKLSD